MISFEVRGVNDVLKKLALIGDNGIKGMNTAIKKSIGTLETEIKYRVPVDTGRLRASFGGGTFEGGSFPKGSGISISQLRGVIGSNVKYAEAVHEGYAKHTTGMRKYASLAMSASKGIIRSYFTEQLRKAIKK